MPRGVTGTPLPLVTDGDLLATVNSMLCLRGVDTVKVSKVKGHAAHAMVDNGDVRLEDLIGNDGADTAADLVRLRQQDDVITAGRDLLRTRRHWYPIMHTFMVAISRIEVNHDGYGGTALDAVVWDSGRLVKPRASSLRVTVDHATLHHPPPPPGVSVQTVARQWRPKHVCVSKTLRSTWKAVSNALERLSAAGSAAYMHGSDMCGRRCSWLLRRSSTTAPTRWSRTTPYGDRTRELAGNGHRRLHLRGRGRASSRSLGRREVTAAGGTSRENASRPSAGRYRLGRR